MEGTNSLVKGQNGDFINEVILLPTLRGIKALLGSLFSHSKARENLERKEEKTVSQTRYVFDEIFVNFVEVLYDFFMDYCRDSFPL